MKILNSAFWAILVIPGFLFRQYAPPAHHHLTQKETLLSSNLVTISVDNFKNQRLNFYYHDSLGFGHPVTMAARETGILINAPTLLFESNNRQTPFLIQPGEKINIKYAGTDSTMLYIKNNEQRTSELNFFRKLVIVTGNIYYNSFNVMPYQKKVGNLNDLRMSEKTISILRSTRLNFLHAYTAKYPVRANFNKIAINAINSSALSDTLLLYAHNQALLGPAYKKFVFEKISALKAIEFQPFQIYYSACCNLLSLCTSGKISDVITSSADLKNRVTFIYGNFSSAAEAFLLSNTIFQAYNCNITITASQLQDYLTQCPDKAYSNLVMQRLNQQKQMQLVTDGSDKLLFTDGKTKKDIRAVISQYKGKIVLLDFWASWCSPCRAEMPGLKNLEVKYQNKNIAFVTISSDKQIDDWQRAAKEESLADNSFLLLNFYNSSFARQYKINSIPRYMLINAAGKIINDDAPRPSDPLLYHLLDAALNK
jgi:thiol-disulfide isomerase/thioredoxin